MKRQFDINIFLYIIAFFLALLIHYISYLFLSYSDIKIIKNANNDISKNIQIQHVKLFKKSTKKKQQKTTTKNKSSVKKKEIIKSKKARKIISKRQKNIKKEEIIDPITQSFIDLYGKKFDNFDKQTKLFLIGNLKDIAYLTKRYLVYPQMSIHAKQSGISAVSFILHPNGNISALKIDKSSSYFLLDDNTIETIQEAYSDYPRPLKPTLIKIFVEYKLIRR